VEHDGVAPQRDIPYRRHAFALRHVAQAIEHRLVALGSRLRGGEQRSDNEG